jgi:hypothetical protein
MSKKEELTNLYAPMVLDGVEERFHVRERDNRVAIVLSHAGWSAAIGGDYWYLSIEDLNTATKKWIFRTVYPGGMTKTEALKWAKKAYISESKNEMLPW